MTFFYKRVKLTQAHRVLHGVFSYSFKRSVEFVVVHGEPHSF